ncbi:unnamed protein product [Calypogeia fissa]
MTCFKGAIAEAGAIEALDWAHISPREAIEGTYIDKKCPFTGNVSIRGRILMGTVFCTKMTETIVVRRDYLHFVPKYQRYEKRHSNLSAHVSPAFRVKEGDKVIIGQCRPLSKTKAGYKVTTLDMLSAGTRDKINADTVTTVPQHSKPLLDYLACNVYNKCK